MVFTKYNRVIESHNVEEVNSLLGTGWHLLCVCSCYNEVLYCLGCYVAPSTS